MPGKARAIQARKGKTAFKDRMARLNAARLAARNLDGHAAVGGLSPVAGPSSPTAESSTPVPAILPAPLPGSPKPISASKRKLSYVAQEDRLKGTSSSLPTTIAHLETLQALFLGAVCGQCGRGSISLSHDSTRSKGLSIGLISRCDDCGAVIGRTNTSRTASQSYEVNRAVVAASLNIGIGHRTSSRFCEVIGVPSLHGKTFNGYVKQVRIDAMAAAAHVMESARCIVRGLYEPDADGIIDLAVTFDGTWHRRGHTSKHGAGAVICSVTGLVLDFYVMSLYCQICKTTGERLRGTDEYDKWWDGHKDDCHINFVGSSGGMEAEAAKVMWGRSLRHGMRYMSMIGDGDSKSFNAITKLEPYGAGKTVTKTECVNHVSKRLGTALRNLVTTEKKRGTTLGGRGTGALTQVKIGKLQGYYTKAVRGHNSSVEDMQNAIWAAYYHSFSSDEEPQHHFCPKGTDSWCFYNRAVSQGVRAFHAGKMTTGINAQVAKCIEPIYKRLTAPDLLEKCLLGLTQNQNESFHAQLWLRCPKHIFVTRPRVEVATCLAIAEWNQGSHGIQLFMDNFQLRVSELSIQAGNRRDTTRIMKAETALQEPAKKRRQKRKTAAQREEQRLERLEEDSYGAGTGGY